MLSQGRSVTLRSEFWLGEPHALKHTQVENIQKTDDVFFCFCFYFYFWPCLWHVKVPWPGVKPVPQQWPEPLPWQCQILNLVSHQGTPRMWFFRNPWHPKPAEFAYPSLVRDNTSTMWIGATETCSPTGKNRALGRCSYLLSCLPGQ